MSHQPQKKITSESDEIVYGPPPPPPPPPQSSVDSQLHGDLLEYLFSFLPIKDAVQVGTVSTRFKEAWQMNRKLLFGSDFAARFNQQELVDLVERVFEFHKAPEIQAFVLHIDPQGIEALIEKWLGICILKRIKELELEFSQPFLLNSNFLDIRTLETLKLNNCEIQLPQSLPGLKFLNIIVLARIQLTENHLKTLLSNCKLLNTLDISECLGISVMDICARDNSNLKTLKIAYCPSLEEININVPSLKSIFYRGAVIRIQFERALPLKDAFFKFYPSRGYLLSHKVDRLVHDLFYVTVLTTSSNFIEPLAPRVRDGEYREAYFCLALLKELQIIMEGGLFCNPYDIAVFLKSCPCLETLFIDLNGYNFECGLYWKLNEKPLLDKFKYGFNRLRFVKLIGFTFAQYEIELVKVLLQKSQNLEAMVFVLPRNHRTRLGRATDAKSYNKQFRSWTVSKKAKMFLYESHNDRSMSPSHSKF
ncbi:putative FBD-associated F-box protein At1g61330 [Prosopis cineraria]|uniref:putative FBD-associated F-box protein At1g61330 n=1 Tax=Prosopis cineraria TaxID=364024 RepID=UPI00240F96C3|nr:putative FBD-associated F-box protein At1g61330 [Prosopis cineraria]